MATSGSYDFIQTRDSIIYAALRKLGAYPTVSSPSATQVTNAAHALNSMILGWMAEGTYLWKIAESIISLVDGTSSYSISSAIGAEFFYVRRDGIDYPVETITREEYTAIADKAEEGLVARVYVQVDRINERLLIYPNPLSDNSTDTLRCTIYQRFADFDASSDNPDFPVEWSNALIYGLAYVLSPEYGIPLQERILLKKEADEFKKLAQSSNNEMGDTQFAPYLGRRH